MSGDRSFEVSQLEARTNKRLYSKRPQLQITQPPSQHSTKRRTRKVTPAVAILVSISLTDKCWSNRTCISSSSKEGKSISWPNAYPTSTNLLRSTSFWPAMWSAHGWRRPPARKTKPMTDQTLSPRFPPSDMLRGEIGRVYRGMTALI